MNEQQLFNLWVKLSNPDEEGNVVDRYEQRVSIENDLHDKYGLVIGFDTDLWEYKLVQKGDNHEQPETV